MLKKNIITNKIKKGLKNFIYLLNLNLILNQFIMKKYLTIVLLLFAFVVNAQYYSISFVNVPLENTAEFERLETTYWSKVAKHNIENGKQINWGLVARVGGGSDTWNYAFINVYETAEQMADNSVWDPKSILGIDPIEISTNHLTAGYGVTHWSVKAAINDSNNEGTASVWNFGRPVNVNAFIDENVNLWNRAFNRDMGGRVSWGVGQKLNNIEDQYSTVMTWDSFKSVADALKFMNGEFDQPPVRNSKMGEILPDGFTARVIVRDVMWAID